MPNGQRDSKRAHNPRSDRNDVKAPPQNHFHELKRPVVRAKLDVRPTNSGNGPSPPASHAQTSAGPQDQDLTYYPAYCNKASPTWFEWVKLTAHDIHTRLHIQDGYQHSWLTEYRFARNAPQLMFYRNHPIQFVQVVGIVVSFDEYFDRFWLFTIDDSSGLTIDVVCNKPTKEKIEPTQPSASTSGQKSEDNKEEEKETTRLSNLVVSTVELGAVLQVKGVITLFRRGAASGAYNDLKSDASLTRTRREEPVRQISLQRLSKVHDTNQEISLIAARTQFYNSMLARPWLLSQTEQAKLHQQALGEAEHDKKRVKRAVQKRQKLVDTEKKNVEEIQKEYEREEEERNRDAEVARLAGVQLKEKVEQSKVQSTRKVFPRKDGMLGDTRPSQGENDDKRKSHKQDLDVTRAGRADLIIDPDQADRTNDSFGPLEDEKSVLLRLAFG